MKTNIALLNKVEQTRLNEIRGEAERNFIPKKDYLMFTNSMLRGMLRTHRINEIQYIDIITYVIEDQ